MPLRRGEATVDAVARPGLDRVFEALFADRAHGADRLGRVSLRFGYRKEDVCIDVATRRVVEPFGLGHVEAHGETGHIWASNALPHSVIPTLPARFGDLPGRSWA